MFMFISSSSAPVGCPSCGLADIVVWLSLLAIFNTLFGVYQDSKLKKIYSRHLPTSYENLVTSSQILVAKHTQFTKVLLINKMVWFYYSNSFHMICIDA